MGTRTKLQRRVTVLFALAIAGCSSGGKTANLAREAGVGGQQDARTSAALDAGGTGGVGGADAGSSSVADAGGRVDAATSDKWDAGVEASRPDSRRSDAADTPVADGRGGSDGRGNGDASAGGRAGAGGTTASAGTTSLAGTTASAGSTGSSGGSTSPGDDASKNKIGINIGSSLDYETNRIFADAMKTAREWQDPDGEETLSALDDNGWPTQDASICVWHGIGNMQGTYALSFNGQATVRASWGNAAISDQSYDAASNLTTAKLVYSSTDGAGLLLTFTNSKRTASSGTNTGVTNVKLMRPTSVGGSTSYTSEVFTAPFLAALTEFSVLRTMDFTATNANGSSTWAHRTRPLQASQAIGNPSAPAGGWQARGAAWEYAILLANQTGKDLWINIPAQADDEFITKLAQLTRYGSDGSEPYASAQAAPVYPGLDPKPRLYVEFSNEVWNTAGAFSQSQQNHAAAQAEVAAGDSPLDFDGSSNDWYWAWRRTAKRTVDISNIFRAVWGDDAMMTRIRPVLMSQLGYADGPLLQAMLLMVNYYANPDQVANPRMPNYYVYGVGGTAYYNAKDDSSVDAIFTTMADGFVSSLQADANWALAFGLKRIAYEGGPSFDKTSNAARDANLQSAWADPRMSQAIIDQHKAWSQNAGDLLVYFTLAGDDFQWAFMKDVLTPSSPKMEGIVALNAAARSASTYGTPIPATLAGSSAKVPPSWAGGGTSLSQRKWLGFPVHVATPGVFKITLNTTYTAPAEAEVLVDGHGLGKVALSSTASAPTVVTPSLSVGSHGIVVRNVAGTFQLSQVVVQRGP